MALTIKDGAGSTTSLKTTLTGSDHMPHHIIQAVSGTVTVTSSLTSPVYVTGTVTVSQPVNVDLVVGDTITASVANTGFQQAINYITASTDAGGGFYKLLVKTTGSSTVTIDNTAATNAFMAISGANLNDKLAVQLTGSSIVRTGNYDALLVRTTGNVETLVMNPGFSAMIDSITGSSNGDRPLYVNVSGADSFSQKFFDHAMVAISHSYYTSVGGASNYLGVKFPEQYRNVLDAYHNALYVTTTASSVTVDNPAFQIMINHITAATDLSNNDFKIKVNVTGSTETNPVYVVSTQASPVYTTGTVNLGNVVTYYQSVPVVATQLTGNSVVQAGNREALLTSVTGTAFVSFGELTPAFTASMENPIAVKLPNQVFVSSSLFEVTKVPYSQGSALVVKVTASNNETYPVTLSGVSTSAFSEGQALVVRITSSNENNPVHVTGNVSITSTEAQPVITKTKSITNVQKQTYSATYGFNWTTDSGTFVVADADTNRKSLMIHNPSQYEVYVSVGSSSLNGFYIWDVAQPPDNFSFIIYPSGTYTADEYAAAAFHACYFVSQSYNYQKVCVTEIGY